MRVVTNDGKTVTEKYPLAKQYPPNSDVSRLSQKRLIELITQTRAMCADDLQFERALRRKQSARIIELLQTAEELQKENAQLKARIEEYSRLNFVVNNDQA